MFISVFLQKSNWRFIWYFFSQCCELFSLPFLSDKSMHTITFWAPSEAAASAEVNFSEFHGLNQWSIREDSFGLGFRIWAAGPGSSTSLLCDLEEVIAPVRLTSSYLTEGRGLRGMISGISSTPGIIICGYRKEAQSQGEQRTKIRDSEWPGRKLVPLLNIQASDLIPKKCQVVGL